MLMQLFSNPQLLSSPVFLLVLLIYLGSLVIVITIHEFAHAWAADKLGDPTPRIQDRLTLNPLAHLDPLGTILILFAGFGWGKPVMFDPFNLKDPRRDAALIALAGPASNIILAVGLAVVMRLILAFAPTYSFVLTFLEPLMSLNIMLALFNLIPVHPLDGGKILVGFLPPDLAHEAEDLLNKYGMIILILLIFPFAGTSPVSALLSPAIGFLNNLLLP